MAEILRFTVMHLNIIFISNGSTYMQPLLLLMAGWFGSVAQAGGFEPKTMRDPLSKRAIERGLVLGKGWVELRICQRYESGHRLLGQ